MGVPHKKKVKRLNFFLVEYPNSLPFKAGRGAHLTRVRIKELLCQLLKYCSDLDKHGLILKLRSCSFGPMKTQIPANPNKGILGSLKIGLLTARLPVV